MDVLLREETEIVCTI